MVGEGERANDVSMKQTYKEKRKRRIMGKTITNGVQLNEEYIYNVLFH